jgi:hypothetical protein
MSKLFNIHGGSIEVRQNGHGFDKKCPVTKSWSVLFLSGLTRSETNSLTNLFK